MSIGRFLTTSFVLLLSCASKNGTRVQDPPAAVRIPMGGERVDGAPRAPRAPAALASSSTRPERLAPPPAPIAWGHVTFDADAGAFVPPAGVFLLIHERDGNTETLRYAKGDSCARVKGRAAMRLEVELSDAGAPVLRATHREGDDATLDCLTARMGSSSPWRKDLEISAIEVLLSAP